MVAVLVAGSSAVAFQQGAARRPVFTDDVYGFSIEAPRYRGVEPNTPSVRLVVSGPIANGFAPNINVTVQAVSTTLKAYIEQSQGQLNQGGLKLNGQRELKVSGRDAVEFDYEGELKPGLRLRFLSVAVVEKGRVVLATAPTPTDLFPGVEAEVREALASFQIK